MPITTLIVHLRVRSSTVIASPDKLKTTEYSKYSFARHRKDPHWLLKNLIFVQLEEIDARRLTARWSRDISSFHSNYVVKTLAQQKRTWRPATFKTLFFRQALFLRRPWIWAERVSQNSPKTFQDATSLRLVLVSSEKKKKIMYIKYCFHSPLICQCLYLEGNKLTALPDSLFTSCPNLRWLDLRNNKLVSIPSSIEKLR